MKSEGCKHYTPSFFINPFLKSLLNDAVLTITSGPLCKAKAWDTFKSGNRSLKSLGREESAKCKIKSPKTTCFHVVKVT